jgi:hypothetical protein
MFTAGVAAETRRQVEKEGPDALPPLLDVRCNRIDEATQR